ncbi:ribose-5-phosphate isomerase RpiA [Oxalobacter paraformigenes]|uniref:Ribose-5-phosphate isomerase A n=1 Tax=Oxalobacter paraformigenes TaxID=556268 RepID=C3X4E3_9BURK|nr:ribose-5-phosphate isomerase RpiA [Oxalobacter paraformigenes]EEO28079.1 ribose 5-phosphate isomerase A [Oxalobacter paraformigenes]
MAQDDLKLSVARAAVKYVPEGKIIGVGTGSTANFFIDELAKIKDRITGAVASSKATAERLAAHGIRVFNLTEVEEIPVYIDGADEITRSGAMIKGGGGALTREKIIASAAARFICIADESKLVATLGKFPLPVEVIPMAYKLVAGKLDALGGRAELRIRDGKPFVTDNGNLILDVFGLQIGHPLRLEEKINNFTGVVTVGLFAQRGADLCLLGSPDGVGTLEFGN